MTAPKVEPVRHYDEHGRLLAAGVLWSEYAASAELMCQIALGVGFTILFPALVYLCASLLFSKSSGYELTAAIIFMAGMAIIAIALADWRERKWRQLRALVFYRDGLMHTPYGIPSDKAWDKVAGHHDIVRSIELEKARVGLPAPLRDRLDAVTMYSHEGTQVTLGRHLCPSISMIVAVQLNKALQDIRKAAAAPAQNAAPRAGRRKID
jgi:hypothetical protein